MSRDIEKEPETLGMRDQLSKLEMQVESEAPYKEPKSYEDLITQAKDQAATLRTLQKTSANLEIASPEHTLARTKMAAAEARAAKLLVNIHLADAAKEVAAKGIADPALRMPKKYG